MISASNDQLAPPMSHRQAKRAARKEAKRAALKAQNASTTLPPAPDQLLAAGSGGGKAQRARLARAGLPVTSTHLDHRAAGHPASETDCEAWPVVKELERLEQSLRVKAYPGLSQRRDIPVDNHGSMLCEASADRDRPPSSPDYADLSERKLRALSPLPNPLVPLPAQIVHLDLSRNELFDLPSLAALTSLETLDLSRNWFQTLPSTISDVPTIKVVRASHNMLRGSQPALIVPVLAGLHNLSVLDIRFNQKCGHAALAATLSSLLPSVDVQLTVCFPRPPDAFVGESPADRDATLLRSQLEPWPTTMLRRRLVADFGQR